MDALKRTIAFEGTSSLFAATVPLTLIEIPYAAARFVVFDLVSRLATDALPPLDDSGALAVSLFAGAVSGAFASLITQPLDTVVVRVCEGSPEREQQPAASSTTAVGPASTAFAAAGQAGDATSSSVLMEAAEAAKAEAAEEEGQEMLCSADEAPPSGVLDFVTALTTIAREEGVGALFAGATTRALYIATLSAVQFFLYEFAKQLLHISPGDLLLFFDVLSGLEIGGAT